MAHMITLDRELFGLAPKGAQRRVLDMLRPIELDALAAFDHGGETEQIYCTGTCKGVRLMIKCDDAEDVAVLLTGKTPLRNLTWYAGNWQMITSCLSHCSGHA